MNSFFVLFVLIHISWCMCNDEAFQWIQFESSSIAEISENSRWVVGINEDKAVIGFADAIKKQGHQQFLKLYPLYPLEKIKVEAPLSMYGNFCKNCPILQCMCSKYGTAHIVNKNDIVFNQEGSPLFRKTMLYKVSEKIEYYFPRKYVPAYMGALFNVVTGISTGLLLCSRYNVKPVRGIIFLYGVLCEFVGINLIGISTEAKPGKLGQNKAFPIGCVFFVGGLLLGAPRLLFT